MIRTKQGCGIILAFFIAFVCIILAFKAWGQDSNPKEIQQWYASLTNRMGGSCCGEGDAYPAAVMKMPVAQDSEGRENYHEDGEVCVTDPSAKEIKVGGIVIKSRAQLQGNLCHSFSWMKMTKEKFGNPTDQAIVFLSAAGDGSIQNIYCVVILPQIY